MTDTVIVLKIYLEEPGIENRVLTELKSIKIGSLKDSKIEPLAFGLNLIRAAYLLPEGQESLAETLQEKIRSISGVTGVEVEAMSLL